MKTKIVLGIIIAFVSILSFYLSYKIAKRDTTIIKRNEIAVPQEFILNPSLQVLSANIEGELTEKGNDYFVLESGNNKVKIFIEPRGLTTFALSSQLDKYIKYEDLKVGDTLKGGISIVISEESTIGMTGNKKRGDIIAHFFAVKNR